MENIIESKIPCGCGRSPSGFCTGLHSLTEEEYETYLLDYFNDTENNLDSEDE